LERKLIKKPIHSWADGTCYISLCRKVICLFCVLTLRSPKPWCILSCCWYHSKVINEYVGMHQVGFIMFHPKVEKLLNIEHFFIKFLFKWKIKIIGESKCVLGIIGKPLQTRILWTWFEKKIKLMCERYWIFNSFCHWKFILIFNFFFTIKSYHQGYVNTWANNTCHISRFTWVYLWRKIGYLYFVCHIEISQMTMFLATFLVPLKIPCAPSWFHNISTYGEEIIEYKTNFHWKFI
jgi:hypothetical protein